MWIYLVVFLVFATNSIKSTEGVDPSACQKNIKLMLITACGATKRNSQMRPAYRIMDDSELEERYSDLVRMNMIRGLEQGVVDEPPVDHLKQRGYLDNIQDTQSNDVMDMPDNRIPLYRFRRDLFGLGMRKDKTYAETLAHERRGSFHFISRVSSRDDDRSPLPGLLKAKCCGGPYLCTIHDFKGFCG